MATPEMFPGEGAFVLTVNDGIRGFGFSEHSSGETHRFLLTQDYPRPLFRFDGYVRLQAFPNGGPTKLDEWKSHLIDQSTSVPRIHTGCEDPKTGRADDHKNWHDGLIHGYPIGKEWVADWFEYIVATVAPVDEFLAPHTQELPSKKGQVTLFQVDPQWITGVYRVSNDTQQGAVFALEDPKDPTLRWEYWAIKDLDVFNKLNPITLASGADGLGLKGNKTPEPTFGSAVKALEAVLVGGTKVQRFQVTIKRTIHALPPDAEL